LLDKDQLAEHLIKEFKKIKSVSIDMESRKSKKITVTERKPVGVWCIIKDEQCYYFDLEGIAYHSVPKSTGFLFPNIEDHREREIELGGIVEENEWISNILSVQSSLKFAGIGIMTYSIASDSYDEYDVMTSEGWTIKLKNQTNVHQQIDSLIKFLSEKLTKDERDVLEYVDLRVQDKIYYK
jgi:cell division septal protein FtsQ